MTTDHRANINAAIMAAAVPRHLVTEDIDGRWSLPGLVMGPDPHVDGAWRYDEAQGFDPDTMAWDGSESGDLDDLDIAAAIKRAVARVQ